MKCPKCGGEMEYSENFKATSYYKIIGEDKETISVEYVKDDNSKTISCSIYCKDCNFELKNDNRQIEFE